MGLQSCVLVPLWCGCPASTSAATTSQGGSALNNHSRIIRLSYFSTLHRPPREYKNSRPLLRKSQYLQLSYPRSSVLRFFHSKARFKAPFSTGVLHLGSIAESSPPHRRSRW
ncbi:hypothetical protein F5B17DRAFT_256689 [Nemania serpens]|nr:hypothetical protein F5B17DRAFT_256689 [Nemania serpens]